LLRLFWIRLLIGLWLWLWLRFRLWFWLWFQLWFRFRFWSGLAWCRGWSLGHLLWWAHGGRGRRFLSFVFESGHLLSNSGADGRTLLYPTSLVLLLLTLKLSVHLTLSLPQAALLLGGRQQAIDYAHNVSHAF
jgi:hypothetical protein